MSCEKPVILLSIAATKPQTYQRAVWNAGGMPVGGYLPECGLPEAFDGLLLGGGGDLMPSWYGEPNWASDTLDPTRDSVEFQLVQEAMAHNRPIFGICRGIQVLNVFLGGSLIQDLGDVHSMVGGNYRLHTACAKAGSKIAALYGAQTVVNSGHHQAIRKVAPHCTVTQRADDGVIEGIEHQCLPILGVQWHPEQMCQPAQRQEAANGALLFEAFISCCRKNSGHW